jgi:hypothetical protein
MALSAATFAYAGTRVLGFEIGVTTVDQLKQHLSRNVKVESLGVNKYSGGAMLKTDGDAYDIDGLKSVVYIFDDERKLAGVLMDIGKHRFDAVFQFLNEKYKLVSHEAHPTRGRTARFRPAESYMDTYIDLDASQLGSSMEVRYIRSDLMYIFSARNKAEADARRNAESSKF